MRLIAFLIVGLSVFSHTLLKTPLQTTTDTISRLKQELRKPLPDENQLSERDAITRRQAEVAARLLQLGQADTVWPLFAHSPDSTLRTYLIHGLVRAGVAPAVIIRRLKDEKDVSARRALILSLGQVTDEQLTGTQKRTVVEMLLRWYRDDPDSGIHASIDWLLRHRRQGQKERALNWQQMDQLEAIDREMGGRRLGNRNWYVTREVQVMILMRGPVEFRMGSPTSEAGRKPASDSPDEQLHRVSIPRSFAISSKEVTVGQFRRFLNANAEVKRKHSYTDNPGRMEEVLREFSPDDDGPQIAVNWYEAAMYCNWLSKQEGLPPSEWVYPTNLEEIKDGMSLPIDYLRRTGYRLPTEAEWEYAARAGSTTARFFGISESLLHEYAWYSRNPPRRRNDPVDPSDPQRTWPVGQLKPNDLGLFDVYGNVWEWTQDRMQQYQLTQPMRIDDEDSVLVVSDREARSRRGGGFPYEAAMMRSAARGTINAFPMLRRDNVGFRVARTYR